MSHDRAVLPSVTDDPDVYRRVFAGLGHGLLLLSPAGVILDVNDADLGEVGEAREDLALLLADLIAGECSEIRTNYRFMTRGGRSRTLGITARMIDLDDQSSVVAVAFEPGPVEVSQVRARLASIVEATSDLIGSFILDGSCRWLNPSAEAVLGMTSVNFNLFDAMGEGAESFRRHLITALIDHGRWVGEIEIRIADRNDQSGDRSSDRREIHLAANVIADRDSDERVTGWTLVGHDFTEYKALQATLAHKASHDTLTGLPNRALLNDRLAEAAVSGTDTTVVFVDLDDFKALNDTFGHEFGDDALIDVASRIAAAVRHGGFAARFGGDEFVVLPDPSWEDPVAELERLVFAEPFTIGPIIIDISGRMGIATASPGESASVVIARADREMYRAKRRRRSDRLADRPTGRTAD